MCLRSAIPSCNAEVDSAVGYCKSKYSFFHSFQITIGSERVVGIKQHNCYQDALARLIASYTRSDCPLISLWYPRRLNKKATRRLTCKKGRRHDGSP